MDFTTQYKDIIYNKMSVLSKWDKRKVAMFGLERQYKSYCQFADKKIWNRKEEYRILLNKCWDVILNEQLLDESVWEYHETFKSENEVIQKTISYEEKCNEYNLNYANIFAGQVEEMLNCLIDDDDNEEAFLLLYIDCFIIDYLCDVYEKEQNLIYTTEQREELYQSDLVKMEIKSQFDDIDNVSCVVDYSSVFERIAQSSGSLG
ncbi:MAG: hypothetical protein HFJ03_12020 [Lachnospira sp.]|jgi:hypothetical protein|nr:hypothetical protein [Lachnospira sp.]